MVRTGIRKHLTAAAFLSLLLLCTAPAVTVQANVTFTTEKEGDNQRIGIVGNPDFYPYEYYNEETGEYEGVFPELFALISARSGIDFEYVDCGTADVRLVDQKTGYAEIVSAYIRDDREMSNYLMTNAVPIVSYTSDKKKVEICFVFGKYASEETIQKVTEAMTLISEEEITSLLGKYVNHPLTEENTLPLLRIVIVLSVLVLIIGGILVYYLLREKKNKKLTKDKAHTDPLTGIGNRAYFEEEFGKKISFQYNASYVIAYIAFDIGRVNKYYGEQKAEEQLSYAANILSADGKNQELTARIAGGAFGILHVCTSKDEAYQWGMDLVSRINLFSKQYDNDYKPEFKAGIYRLENGQWNFKQALKSAERCYDTAVKQNLAVFVANDAMEKQDKMSATLTHEARNALQTHQFVQYLQPIVSTKTEQIIGAEGLARWNHPRYGLLTPYRFVHVLIDEGMIVDLDMYLFEESCRKQAQWKKEGKRYRLSTNFTRMSITSSDFTERVRTIVDRYYFDHPQLVVEITEDSLEKSRAEAIANVNALKEMGFRIALDDLGSGFTFFADIKDYPLDIIKIDRDMLLNATDAKGKAFMMGIVDTCKRMGMEIICEGVENQEQCDFVKEIGCDMIQGFYYFRPLSSEQAAEYM